MQEALSVIGFLVGFAIGKELYEIINLKRREYRKVSYRISDHISDKALHSEPLPPISAEGFMRAFVGISPFALSLVFEFYKELDKEGTIKFLSKVLLEFIKDLQENEEEFRKLAKTKFVVEYTRPLGLLGGCATSPSKWLFVDVSRDYIEWLMKTYGIAEDELMNIAVVSHMLKTRGNKVIVRLASYLDAMVCSFY
jgi:prefoldin subunit 5